MKVDRDKLEDAIVAEVQRQGSVRVSELLTCIIRDQDVRRPIVVSVMWDAIEAKRIDYGPDAVVRAMAVSRS